jgi:hypothetical protein
MELFLSSNSTTNTVLVDASNVAHYEIKTPFKFTGGITTIQKVCRGDRKSSIDALSNSGTSVLDDSSVKSSTLLAEKSTELAEIHWRFWASSTMQFGGIEFDLSEYMPSEGIPHR